MNLVFWNQKQYQKWWAYSGILHWVCKCICWYAALYKYEQCVSYSDFNWNFVLFFFVKIPENKIVPVFSENKQHFLELMFTW